MDVAKVWRGLDLFGCLALYVCVGPALILVNKEIMTSYGFGYPMLVSGLGQVSSAVGSFLVVRVFRWQPLSDQARSVDWDFYLKNMVVVGAAFATSLSLGNAGYMYLSVSFIQMLKAFTPCVVVAALFLSGVERPSPPVAAAVAAMSAGTLLAAVGEANFEATGFLIMIGAEAAEATRLVLTQRLLCNLKFGAFEGLYLMAPICAFWMWGVALLAEVPTARARGDLAIVLGNPAVFGVAALLGFAVNVASFLVIKRTSSVMIKLLGTARNAGLVLVSALALGDEVTRTQAAGYVLTLGFFAVYNYLKFRAGPEKRGNEGRTRRENRAPRDRALRRDHPHSKNLRRERERERESLLQRRTETSGNGPRGEPPKKNVTGFPGPGSTKPPTHGPRGRNRPSSPSAGRNPSTSTTPQTPRTSTASWGRGPAPLAAASTAPRPPRALREGGPARGDLKIRLRPCMPLRLCRARRLGNMLTQPHWQLICRTPPGEGPQAANYPYTIMYSTII